MKNGCKIISKPDFLTNCLEICQQTDEFYKSVELQLGDCAFGYKVFSGPPIFQSPILFIGYQPGGGVEARADGMLCSGRLPWSETHDLSSATWPLAQRMRTIWSAEFLSRCMTTEAVFVRAPSKIAWRKVARNVRKSVEEFSSQAVYEIIKLIEPRQIVLIGFGNLSAFRCVGQPLLSGARRLAQPGFLQGIPACEIIHLSGARVSRSDREKLAEWLGANLVEDARPLAS